MGLTSNLDFTFQKTDGTTGDTNDPVNGVVTIRYLNDANAIHESTHGLQKLNGVITTEDNLLTNEFEAYKHQFSFDHNSVIDCTVSYWGGIKKIDDITENWVFGLNDRSDLEGINIYAKILLNKNNGNAYSKEAVIKILDTNKEAGQK